MHRPPDGTKLRVIFDALVDQSWIEETDGALGKCFACGARVGGNDVLNAERHDSDCVIGPALGVLGEIDQTLRRLGNFVESETSGFGAGRDLMAAVRETVGQEDGEAGDGRWTVSDA